MDVLLATMSLVAAGGSETYLLTVAEQLQRLGHDATIYAVETGPFADFARDRVGSPARELRRVSEAERLPPGRERLSPGP